MARARAGPVGALVLGGAVAGTAATGVLHAVAPSSLATFVLGALALAALAGLVGRSVETVSESLGAGVTGTLQAALGNLPELFVGLFALHAGLVPLVQAALVGSVVANLLLVAGLAFVVGGLRRGPLRFEVSSARVAAAQLLLAVGAVSVATLAGLLHTGAARHERAVSTVVAIALLAVFVVSLPAALRGGRRQPGGARLAAPLAILVLSGVGAAFVSDWFVAALRPALTQLGVSEAFAGLVIVAIAGNAVENAVAVGLAGRGRPDVAVAIVLASPLQITLVVLPVLVLVSPLLGTAALTLAFPPLLLAVLVVAVIVVSFVIADGEAHWLEGVALIALYAVSAVVFWWR